MKILRRRWYGLDRSSTFQLYPLGDCHIGNVACDEKMLKAVVKRIAADENAYWVGLGDYCDFVSRKDRRFSVETLPDWLQGQPDINAVQRDRFLDIVRPIAGQCLGLVEGNHERTIKDQWERDVYLEIVGKIREFGEFDAGHELAFGYSGWLMLHFYRSEERARGTLIKVNLHHGFVGGKLAGAKALNMQRWLWNHECDLAIMGHSHNTAVQVEAVEKVKGNRVAHDHRIGMYGGTFMSGARYSEAKGYFPLPLTQPYAILQPGAPEHRDRIKVVS